MAEESQDESSKTEEPTQKRLEEARKRGQTVSTRELNHFFMMLALAFFIFILAPNVGKEAMILLAPFITSPDQYEISSAGVSTIFSKVILGAALILALPLLISIIAAIAPAIIQGKWVFSTEQIKPKFDKISPLSGFKRIFALKALVEFLKNLLKITIVGAAAVMVVLPYRHQLPQLMLTQKTGMLGFTQTMAGRMMIAACIILFLLSILDYVYQRIMFMKSMRMSKQELKDEYKQQEGDPHVKQKLKQIRRERARKRMMANVPKADVIITNPTHYAIALQYDAAIMPAPKVLAKGADEVARRIRELAGKHKVPIVRNPPLARILYDTTDIDDEIPFEHYQAVAKIIGYVYRLKGKVPPQPAGKDTGKKVTIPTLKKKK